MQRAERARPKKDDPDYTERDKPWFIGRDVVTSQNIAAGRGGLVIGFYIYSHCYVWKNKTEYL